MAVGVPRWVVGKASRLNRFVELSFKNTDCHDYGLVREWNSGAIISVADSRQTSQGYFLLYRLQRCHYWLEIGIRACELTDDRLGLRKIAAEQNPKQAYTSLLL